jgi:hypothetical protein
MPEYQAKHPAAVEPVHAGEILRDVFPLST